MVVKEIRDFPVLHALERFMDEEKLYDGYYSLYRRIDDMNFVIWSNKHLARRGGERGYLSNKRYWMEVCLSVLTENEEVFWHVLENKESFLVDEESNYAFVIRAEAKSINGIVVNKLYIKTFIKLRYGKTLFVESSDGVVSYDRVKGIVTSRPAYVEVK